jgi:hypothetical protein
MKTCSVLLLVASLFVAAMLTPAKAAVLSNVPMQGTMVMPQVKYDAAAGRLRVAVDPAIPQLTPLLVSNPDDHFDSGDPWFPYLDPRGEGLAFSRRYGFVMDGASDPLPGGTAMAIRKSSGSLALEFFRYRSSVPKVWEPIFGTAGCSDTFIWDGMMFHPCVTAPAGTNTYSASFEVFLMDTLSGQELPGTSTGAFELRWTDVPDGRPVLEIGWKVTIAFPSTAGWALEFSDQLRPATWATVTNAPVTLDGGSAVVIDAKGAAKFYRMRRLP